MTLAMFLSLMTVRLVNLKRTTALKMIILYNIKLIERNTTSPDLPEAALSKTSKASSMVPHLPDFGCSESILTPWITLTSRWGKNLFTRGSV